MSAKAKTQTPATPEQTPQTPAQTPAERRAARIAAEDKIRAEGGVVFNAAGRPTARRLTCLCGCGEPTHTDEAWFKSGHDAKLRKLVLDHTEDRQTIEVLPAIVIPFFKLGAPIAGLQLEAETGRLIDTKAGR